MRNKVKMLYDALKADGADVGTENEFSEWFHRPGEEGYRNRLQVYEAFKADGADVGETYEEFKSLMGLHAVGEKAGANKPAQAAAAKPAPQQATTASSRSNLFPTPQYGNVSVKNSTDPYPSFVGMATTPQAVEAAKAYTQEENALKQASAQVWNDANKRVDEVNTDTSSRVAKALRLINSPISFWSSLFIEGSEKELARYKELDFERLADEMAKKLPESIKQQYTPEGVRSLCYGALYERAVEANAPKGALDFLVKKIGDGNIFNPYWLRNTVLGLGTGNFDLNRARQEGQARYGEDHMWLDLAGTVANMGADPTTYVGGWAAKAGMGLAGKGLARYGLNYFGKTMGTRFATGAIESGLNFGTYEALKDVQQQAHVGGVYNEKTGKREGYSVLSPLESFGHGLAVGGVIGAGGTLIGNVGDKAVANVRGKGTKGTMEKAIIRGAQGAVSTVFNGTVFATDGYWQSGFKDFDLLHGIATDFGFKVGHLPKSAIHVVGELRPVKSPKNIEERNHNRKSFIEHVDNRLSRSASDFDFNKDDREELKRNGYGTLSDVFKRDRKGPVNFEPENDGYTMANKAMEDPNLSYAVKAKIYNALTGRYLAPPTVVGARMGERDGVYIVESTNDRGEVITSRTYKNTHEARNAFDAIVRQSELNGLGYGELGAEARAAGLEVKLGIEKCASELGCPVEDVRTILGKWLNGEELTTEQVRIAQMVDAYTKEMAGKGDELRPRAIREKIWAETGVDVEKASRKMIADRTEAEDAAVDSYLEELYKGFEKSQEQETSEDGGELGSGTDQNDAELEAARADFEAAFGIDADYWMGRVEEDVMGVLSEPTLNEDRRMAVLRYVGARRRAAARVSAAEAVRAKVHPNKNTIVPAVLKLGDQQVFVVGGDVMMSADGKVVDLQKSSRSVLVYNAETGETKFVEPSAILRVEVEVDPQAEIEAMVEQASPVAPPQPSSPTPTLPAREGAIPADGVSDSAVSSAENGANSAVAAEAVAETALSRVPVDEKGKAQFDKVEPALAWDAVMEKTGGDAEMAKDFVDNMVAESEKALAKLEKGKPKSSTDIDEFIANKKAHQDAIAEAKRVLEHWKAVAEEEGARNSSHTPTLPAREEAPTDAEEVKASEDGARAEAVEKSVAEQEGELRSSMEQNEGEGGTTAEGVADELAVESEHKDFVEHKLNEQEAADFVAKMESMAEVAPTLELTPDNWIAEFGEDGRVETPIGVVKMGENQFIKLHSRNRGAYFGMVKPTLMSPDVILEEYDPKDGAERDSKCLFIKTFVKEDGTRVVYFESVTVQKDGMEVSISSHEIQNSALKKKMQNDRILHLAEKLSSSSELRLTETPSKSERPDLVPTSDNMFSADKDSALSADLQASKEEISDGDELRSSTEQNVGESQSKEEPEVDPAQAELQQAKLDNEGLSDETIQETINFFEEKLAEVKEKAPWDKDTIEIREGIIRRCKLELERRAKERAKAEREADESTEAEAVEKPVAEQEGELRSGTDQSVGGESTHAEHGLTTPTADNESQVARRLAELDARIREIEDMFLDDGVLPEGLKDSYEARYAHRSKLMREAVDGLATATEGMSDEELERLSKKYESLERVLNLREHRREAEQERQSERDKLQTTYDNAEALPVSGKKPKKFSMHEVASTDAVCRPMVTGVHHSPTGEAVATDTRVIVVSKKEFNAEHEGKVVDKNGDPVKQKVVDGKKVTFIEPTGKFPAYERVLPKDKPVATAPLSDEAVQAACGVSVRGEQKAYIAVDFGDGNIVTFDLYHWNRFVRGAKHIGASELEFRGADKPVAARSEDGWALCMPTVEVPELAKTYRQDLNSEHQSGAFADMEARAAQSRRAAEARKQGGEKFRTEYGSEERTGSDGVMPAEEVRAGTKKWTEATGIEVQVFDRAEEIEDEYLRGQVKAQLDMGLREISVAYKGKVYVYGRGVKNAESLEKSMIHEIVTHLGLEGVLGAKGKKELLGRIWTELMSPAEQDKWMKYPGVRDKFDAAEEWLAHKSETMDVKGSRSLWAKIGSWFRDLLGRFGLKLKLTDDVLLDTLRRSYQDLVAKKNVEARKEAKAKFNLRQFNESGRERLHKELDKLAGKGLINRKLADEIKSSVEYAYNVCKAMLGEFESFDNWSVQEVRTEEEWYTKDGKKRRKKPVTQAVFSVIKTNGDYDMNLDFSLLCKKRETLDAVIQALADEGIFENTTLKGVDIARIKEIIRSRGLEAACDICFVDSKRYRVGDVAATFVELWNGLAKLPDAKLKKLRNMTNQQLQDYLFEEGVFAEHTSVEKKRRDEISNTVEKKVADYFLKNPDARVERKTSDFLTASSFDNMRINFNDVLKFYNMKKGTGGPKASSHNQVYHNEILDTRWTPESAFKVGGVRLQSFSDFQGRMVFDYIQLIADLAARRLPVHAYTKEVLFAKLFGLTGMKINLSLIPSAVVDGVAPGLDKNGDYIWADGQSFPFDEAVKLMSLEGYRDNCGTIAIGVSDMQIWKMLDDPIIRMIIPYHKSGIPADVAALHGIYKFKDYTKQQNTRQANGSALSDEQKKSHFNYNAALKKYGDARVAANRYLEWCRENNYIPKFEEFADHPNYYKLLEDFTTMVPDGNGGEYNAAMEAVRPVFPSEVHNDPARGFGDLATLIRESLEFDNNDVKQRKENLKSILDEAHEKIFTPERLSSEDYDLKVEEELDETEADVRFRLGDEESFEERQKRAVENKGIVTPGLKDMSVREVNVPNHPFKGSWGEARSAAVDAATIKYSEIVVNKKGEEVRQLRKLLYNNFGKRFEYTISRNSLKESVNGNQIEKSENQGAARGIHLAVLDKLEEVIGNSVEFEEQPSYPKNDNNKHDASLEADSDILVHKFVGVIENEGKRYRVITTMLEYRQSSNPTREYAYDVANVEVLNEETLSTSNGATTASKGHWSVAKLLNNLEKRYDPGKKVLDESENNVRFRVGDDVLLGEEEYPLTSERGTKLRGVEDGVAVYVDKDGRPTVLLCAAGDGSFIGLKRKPGTNRWSCKAENDMGPDVWRKVITTALAKLPEGAEVYENKSLSVDGMRMFGKMLENGFERTGETFACEVNVSDKANVFEANEAARRNFSSVRRHVDEIEDVRDRMQAGLDALDLDREAVRIEPNPRSDFGRVKVEAPVLRKTSRSGVEVSMGVELSEQGRRMQARAEELGAKLGTKIRIEVDTEALRGKRSQAKGWYDTSTGEVVVVVPNHSSVADVENTVVHEIVGHKGLRAMVGEERFGAFLDDVYNRASQKIRDAIDARAAKGGMSSREATEEYMSDMAGEIGDKGFEQMDHASRTFWGKVIEGVRQMIDFVMRGIGLNKKSEVNDKEVAYMLYKSWKGMRAKSGAVAAAEDALMRAKTGFNQVGELRSDTEQNDANGRRFRLSDEELKSEEESRSPMDDIRLRTLAGDEIDNVMLQKLGPDELVVVTRNVQVMPNMTDLASPMAGIDHETGEYRILDPKSWNGSYASIQLTEEQVRMYDDLVEKGYTIIDGKEKHEFFIAKGLKFIRQKDSVDLQYNLKKYEGDGDMYVSFNPYDHGKFNTLNLQFSTAYKRPNLVMVEAVMPKSELMKMMDNDEVAKGMYHSPYAKNSVGIVNWGRGEYLALSRWSKIIRVLPNKEVAERIDRLWREHPEKSPLGKTGEVYDPERYTPQVLQYLEEMGWEFDPVKKAKLAQKSEEEKQKEYGKMPYVTEEDIAKLNARYADNDYASMFGSDSKGFMREAELNTWSDRVESLAEKFGDKVRIYKTAEEAAADGLSEQEINSKGFYRLSTGEITIILDHHNSLEDLVNTYYHESIGHDGIRRLFPTKQLLNNFLDEIYRVSGSAIQKEIDDEAAKLQELNPKWTQEQCRRVATEEYGARIAEKYSAVRGKSSETFEKISKKEETFWGNIVSLLQEAFDKLLKGMNIPVTKRWSNKQWAYVYHKAYKAKIEAVHFQGGQEKSTEDWQDLTTTIQSSMDETTKIVINKEEAKNNLLGVVKNFSGIKSTRGYIKALSVALGYPEGVHKQSFYFEMTDRNGIPFTLRISNHNANSEYADKKEFSITIKSWKRENTFREDSNEIVNEFVYFKEKIQNSPEDVLSFVASDIIRLIETGEYQDTSGIAVLNQSKGAKAQSEMEGELRSDTDQNVRFRLGDDVEGVGSVAAREIYEQRVRTSGYQVREALQDSMLGLREAYDAIEKASGRKRSIEDIPTAENAYTGENRLSSRTREEQKAYEELCVKPLLDEVAKLAPDKESRAKLTEYMMAKHGLERNAKMRAKAVADGMDAAEAGATDFAGLTGLAEAAGEVLTGNRVAMAETWATKRVADYESGNATDALWAAVNAATVSQKWEAFEAKMESLAQAEPDRFKRGRQAQGIPYKNGKEVTYMLYKSWKGMREEGSIGPRAFAHAEDVAMRERSGFNLKVEDGDKKTPVDGLPNRINEKQASGSVHLRAKGDSSSNASVTADAYANIAKNTQSAKNYIKRYFNNDFTVSISARFS